MGSASSRVPSPESPVPGPRYTLSEIAAATGGRIEGGAPDAPIHGFTTDSRAARPGDLFVALRGPAADGHAFVADALARGAAAAVVSRAVDAAGPLVVVDDTLAALGRLARLHRDRLDPIVVGVTGSVGKTTTVRLVAAALSARFPVHASHDDWNAEHGVPLTLLGLAPGHRVAVVEMAMRGPGQIRDLVEIARPNVGVVTTIGESHLEFLGSIEGVARAKGELVEGLPPDGAAVLNADDALCAGLRPLARCRVLTYGLSPDADVRGEAVETGAGGVRFRVVAGRDAASVDLAALGTQAARNALGAAAVGVALGLSLSEVAAGLAGFVPPAMRLSLVSTGALTILDDTYNASPASMRAAFEALASVARGERTIAVLGEMRELGGASERLHREVGAAAARTGVAHLIAVGPQARWIAAGAAEAGAQAVVAVDSVDDATRVLETILERGDVVLVKGSRAVGLERVVAWLRAGALLVR